MTSNTVTISASCLSTLPPGDYHYSLFKGIDIYDTTPQKTVEDYQEEIDTLNTQLARAKRKLSKAEEKLRDLSDDMGTIIDDISDC